MGAGNWYSLRRRARFLRRRRFLMVRSWRDPRIRGRGLCLGRGAVFGLALGAAVLGTWMAVRERGSSAGAPWECLRALGEELPARVISIRESQTLEEKPDALPAFREGAGIFAEKGQLFFLWIQESYEERQDSD